MKQHIESANLNESAVIITLYLQAVGSVMFLMICRRYDICFVVSRLLHYMKKPTKSFRTAVERDFRYIDGTLSTVTGCGGKAEGAVTLAGFIDSYWAGCKIYMNVTYDFVLFGEVGAVSWKSKKSQSVSFQRLRLNTGL